MEIQLEEMFFENVNLKDKRGCKRNMITDSKFVASKQNNL